MTRAVVVVATALASAGVAHAKSAASRTPAPATHVTPAQPPRTWIRPAPPLPMQPEVARVRLEVARDRVVVIQDVCLPRGDWETGSLDLYVAFGAPGTPIALDARLVATTRGAGEARAEEPADDVALDTAPRRSAGSQPLLGKPQMAGVVVHVRESQLRRAFASGDAATVRIRSLLAPPAADAQGARDVVVRLGSAGGVPLTLGRVQLVSLEPAPWVSRAEAHLCGPEADPWPLSIAVSPTPEGGAPRAPTIAPELAVRHASDDLCVRWWATP
ncbi:MAG TPA: hypothetical protein VKU41_01385 [Polyangiaceae bacterium]|nr:hypothetical protein [Polyangiaceae bacterium]